MTANAQPEPAVTPEAELAAVVVQYLRDLDWDVHQEVGWAGGSRADIVAVRGRLVAVVEAKTTLGLAVMAQARYWQAWAHYCWVAVPAWRRYTPERVLAEDLLREWGVGLFEVARAKLNYETNRCTERIAPRLWRRVRAGQWERLRERLSNETRTYAVAGNAIGKFWSPFKETCKRIAIAVRNRPGMTTRELVAALGNHHYGNDASARGALPKWLAAGKIPDVRGEGTPMRWYPAS